MTEAECVVRGMKQYGISLKDARNYPNWTLMLQMYHVIVHIRLLYIGYWVLLSLIITKAIMNKNTRAMRGYAFL